jgi:hypothetical protein
MSMIPIPGAWNARDLRPDPKQPEIQADVVANQPPAAEVADLVALRIA